MSNIDLTRPPYRAAAPVIRPTGMVCGTLLSTDLAKSRYLYEEVLRLQCAQITPDRMLVRDLPSNIGPGRPHWVLDVRLTDRVDNQQRLLHHWGVDLETKAAVDQMHKVLTERREELELTKLMETRFQHGAYSFYFADRDSNWWELQYLPHSKRTQLFDAGDVM